MTVHALTIPLPNDHELVIDPASSRRSTLSAEDARSLTAEIQQASLRLWLLVTEAHDRRAHFVLGYGTWDEYVRAELRMSPSRSYQLLDTGHVMRALAAAGVDIDTLSPPPARVVAKVKDRLPEVRKAVRAAVRRGDAPDDVLRELARSSAPSGEVIAMPTAGTPAKVECPGCGGTGKVSKAYATRLRALLKP